MEQKKPISNTSSTINFIAMLVGILALVVARKFGYKNYKILFIIYAVLITLATVIMEYFSKTIKTPLQTLQIRRKLSWKRLFYKEIALCSVFAVIAFGYFLFPMFRYNDFKFHYFPFLQTIFPWILISSIPYFMLMDKAQEEPEDVYYKIGNAILHQKKTLTSFEFGNFVRSWLVKAFWLSLMQPAMIVKIRWLITYNWGLMENNPVEWYWTATVICFFMDLTYAGVGYLMNLKLIGTETKTAEPTLFGWVVAIMCYWPFWGVLFYNYFFNYDAGQKWMNVFKTGSFTWYLWGCSIIGLEFIYGLATVAAGIRFSNLTYRGLWNTGPYRWTKHPAYVTKNLSWWLISMPYMTTGWPNAIRACVLLFGTNMIYYLRAKTEERHLSHYPEYVAYALEMNEKSMFCWVAKFLPFLKYKPLPKDKRIF